MAFLRERIINLHPSFLVYTTEASDGNLEVSSIKVMALILVTFTLFYETESVTLVRETIRNETFLMPEKWLIVQIAFK